MPKTDMLEEISRRSFLKLGVAGLSATVALFISACGGEEDDEEGDDD